VRGATGDQTDRGSEASVTSRSTIPVPLILVSLGQATIEVITAPKQPVYQGAERELLVPPLNPALEAG
jgi:hypothetical protein